jgi:acetylornithine/N-succinyldiaminopimelate aminotransferase
MRDALMSNYARYDVEFVRGEGVALWDSDGNEYLDLFSGIGVCNTGHCHPRVVAAIQEQVARLMHVSNLFYNEPMVRLAGRLAQRSLGGKVYFANSGAEANEAAIKLARKARPRGRFVVLHGGFHGHTYGALSATPQESKQAPFAPLVPGFEPYAPEQAVAAVGPDVAGVIVEPIQGESGVHPLDPEVARALRAACDEHGALLIFDEVQTGMGRTGTLWAYEWLGVQPDLMTLAKGLGGGLPIGALVTSPSCADVFAPGDHGSTFAGGPVVSAAAHAALDVIDDPALRDHVEEMGTLLAEGLREVPGVLGVRGRGLMVAAEVACDAPAMARRALFDQGLVINATGPTTLRFLPPLVVQDVQILDGLSRVRELLASVSALDPR